MRRRLTSISAREWTLALEASGWLVLSALAVRLLPFRWIAPRLGTAQRESPPEVDARDGAIGLDVRRAIGAIGRRTPWTSTCLMNAIAAQAMLRRRHVASTVYLGVRHDPTGAVKAHAWLRCGSAFLTGGEERPGFTVVATFAEPTSSV